MHKRSLGIALSYVNTFASMVCGIVLSSVLLRSIGDEEYGLYQTISSFANYLVMLEFGTGTAMSRAIVIYKNSPRRNRINNCVSTIWYMTVGLAVLIIAVSCVFYMNIGRIYRASMTTQQIDYARSLFVFITVYLVMNYLRQTMNGVLLGMEQYTFSSMVSTANTVVRTALLLALIFFRPYASTIVIVDVCLSVIAFSATFLFCKKKFAIKLKLSLFDRRIVVEFLPLCLALVLQTFVNQANNSVDKFFIGIQMNMTSVAIYSVAQYIYSVFSSITTIPISMYLPQVGKDIAKGLEGKELTETFIQPCRFVALLGGSVVFGFVAVGRPFISVLYGQSKEMAWLYAVISMVPMFVNMTDGILVNVLDVRNKRHVRSYALVGTTILNIAMTVWFISMWGIIGAVIATAIATTLGQILFMNWYYKKAFDIQVLYLFRSAYKGILPFQILAAGVCCFFTYHISSALQALFLGGIAYVILSGGLIIVFGLNTQEKTVLTKLARRFTNLYR